ncbi:MAG TPA: hypothetical protein VLG76_06530 [Rhabdochlamydiaceae bacterium]|nr:hypothetical protein [Rhabdochlamydiaceae bacterium]
MSLYPKNFENWKFDKKAPQNSDLERVTLAGEQGASEDQNFEMKPTQSKPNFRSSLGIFPPTYILRHRKENLKKCSLRGLEKREDFHFFTYPILKLPDLSNYLILTMDGPLLSKEDAHKGLFLLDGTWRYASKMLQAHFTEKSFETRTLPAHFQTAYPRVQNDCPDPHRGLASIEALYIAYTIMGRDTTGLLDHYYWKDSFLEKNNLNTF